MLREDEIKTKENHYYLAISSIINFILIALWVCKLIAEFGNEVSFTKILINIVGYKRNLTKKFCIENKILDL